MKLPAALAAARESAGLSQAQAAKKLRVSTGTVGGWEAGDHGIRWKNLQKAARVYKTTVEKLLGFGGDDSN